MVLPTAERERCSRLAASAKLPAPTAVTGITEMPFRQTGHGLYLLRKQLKNLIATGEYQSTIISTGLLISDFGVNHDRHNATLDDGRPGA